MGYAAEGKVVCGVAESCAGMGCSYRNHYQWMGEECQDGDAGLPLDCTPTPVPTPMPTPQPMRTSRKKGTQRRGCSAPARRCEAQRRGSNGAARDALPMDADTAARVSLPEAPAATRTASNAHRTRTASMALLACRAIWRSWARERATAAH